MICRTGSDPFDCLHPLRVRGGEGWQALIHPTINVGWYAVGGFTLDEMWEKVDDVIDSIRDEGLSLLQVETENMLGEHLRRKFESKIGLVTYVVEQWYCYVVFEDA